MARKHIPNRSIFSHHTRGKHELGEQLIIRVGKGCNFRCSFCNVAENENILSLKSSIKEILALTFYKIKYSNFASKEINVTISGGEPSIFPKETLFILKYFGKYFRDRGIQAHFDIQSNASNIDADFAQKISQLGIQQALISSHTHDPIVFEKVIGVSYATMGPRFEAGVRHLLDAGIFVTFNIVLNKATAEGYIDHLTYLMDKYPEVQLYNIGYVQPHGMAQIHFDELVAQYEDIYGVYNRAIAYLKSKGKTVHSHYVGLPLCYMDDWATSMEYVNNSSLVSQAHTDATLIHSINDRNKVHPKSCDTCIAKHVCSGVWKEFAPIQKLKPIPYQVRYTIKHFDPCELSILKKKYDAGVRQFFFYFDEGSRGDFIEELQKFGFLWISLIFSGERDIFEFSRYASMNLQIFVTHENIKKWIHAIQAYNKTVPFQFQIQLDLILEEKIESEALLQSLIPYLGSHIRLHLPYGSIKPSIPTHSLGYYAI